MIKFIFITGGVVSSLGKESITDAYVSLLRSRGLKVIVKTLDPYFNLKSKSKNISTTSGQVFSNVLKKEREGGYLGETVQIIPHITNEIKDFILKNKKIDKDGMKSEYDYILCEIGGTVGDMEGFPFIEAIRQLRNELGRKQVMFIHLTFIPFLSAANEYKTKPTQHSVKELLKLGIQPDVLLCRCDKNLTEEQKKKISLFCNISELSVISVVDVKDIDKKAYWVVKLDKEVRSYFEWVDF